MYLLIYPQVIMDIHIIFMYNTANGAGKGMIPISDFLDVCWLAGYKPPTRTPHKFPSLTHFNLYANPIHTHIIKLLALTLVFLNTPPIVFKTNDRVRAATSKIPNG